MSATSRTHPQPTHPGGRQPTRAATGRHGAAAVRPAPTRPRIERLLGVVARAAVEVIAGRRPLRQLLRLVSPAVYDRLEARLPDPHDRRPTPTATVVREVLSTWPTPAACEATVLLEQGGRTTALALRAERHGPGWRVVEIAAPEEGLAPTRTRPKLPGTVAGA